MTRYADPRRCPDCREPIEYGAASCPACDLPLDGPLAMRLFTVLTEADRLLAALRTSAPSVVPAAPAATPTPSWPRTQLSAASVPKILLGLGAVCLLVAALVFLAVTWSVMGVAGRTTTLVLVTAVAAGLTAWMAQRNLRGAAEALVAVTLGLLTLDLFGARDSGWLGAISLSDFLVVLGVTLTVVGAGAGVWVRRTATATLLAAELVAVLGVGTMSVGLVAGDRLAASAALVAAVVLAASSAAAAYRLGLFAASIGGITLAGPLWLFLVASSFSRAIENPTARELWLGLEAWPLLAAAVLVGMLAAMDRFPLQVRIGGLAASELTVVAVVLIPFLDSTTTERTMAVLAVLVTAGFVTWRVRGVRSSASAVTMTLAGTWMLYVGGELAVAAGERIAETGALAWTGSVDGRLPQVYGDQAAGWLLPVTALAVLAVGVVLAHSVPVLDRLVAPVADLAIAVGLLAGSAIGAVASYPVPVWVVLVLLALAATAFVVWALARQQVISLVIGAVFLAEAAMLSLHEEWLTAAAMVCALALSVVVHLRWRLRQVGAPAGAVVAASLAGLVWTAGALLDGDRSWVALTSMVVLGALVVGRPHAGIEVGGLMSWSVAAAAGVAAAPYHLEATWGAVYLTVAGVAVSAVALLRAEQRRLGWLGGLLLTAASWVRLWDIGVETPEAYTLPSALALGVVGVLALRRDPGASTMRALSPSLGVVLIPSLLLVVREPVTMRSALLGAACLAILLLGLRLRWAAPILFAASVGCVLVLRHTTPMAEAVPRWMLIGATGALLISMGVTWERRLQEARAVLGYVRGLR